MTELLAEKDLRTLMDVIDDARHDDPTPGMPWALLHGMCRLIGCDSTNFCEFDLPVRTTLTGQNSTDEDQSLLINDPYDPDDPYWRYYQDSLPCVYHERSADLSEAIKFSDFYTRKELDAHPLWREMFNRDNDTKHCMLISMPTSPGHTRRLLVWRDDGSDFTERDRLLMRVLRPHFYEVYLDSQRRLNKVPKLSRRELQVLQLAAQGRSNAEIAHELFVAVSTVRKHMENIFDRTGVRSRAAAAALVLPHLSVPDVR
jgi:DNA-binding CsgD family transcriptional regulator